MDFGKLCKKVFTLDDDIRYAAVIDDTGTVVAGGMRKGIDHAAVGFVRERANRVA